MTRVDLYLLKGNTFSDQIDFCCRLTEKAFPKHPNIHILTAESIQNEALNEALWAFKPESFLPHSLSDKTAPITLGTKIKFMGENNPNNLVISLCPDLPENFNKIGRLCLVILNNEVDIQHARDLYKIIKKQGIEVHTQDLRN